MDKNVNNYTITKDKSLLSLNDICKLLAQSYWANTRSKEDIELSIKNSICYGAFYKDEQVGFARIVTDGATVYWLCDVIIDENHRGKGLGKILLDYIFETEELKGLGILMTKEAEKIYEKYGYKRDTESFMIRF